MLKAKAVLFKIQGKVMFPSIHTFCSSLTKFSSMKSVQTRFVAPQKPLINTFLVIKVIINYDNFIAIDLMKKFGARFCFSDFHRQKFSRQQEPGLREKITENIQLTGYFLQYLLYKTCLSDPSNDFLMRSDS